ncbi:hypothetical protein [Microtetraspora malaysiensis]|nr:hypothetical protein [Microtetraspora malaysiensis]
MIVLLGVELFLFVSLDPGHQVLEVGWGELPSEKRKAGSSTCP